jgi:hypothetical protein
MECGIYLAPSTIPGAGMGMFVGDQHLVVNDTVTRGDIVFPIIELKFHAGAGNNKNVDFLWDEYTWAPEIFPPEVHDEVEAGGAISMASPGMGAAVNCRHAMVNVEDDWEAAELGTAGVDSTSPGAGAFSIYHNRSFLAIRDIPAGMELFASYGENYFHARSSTYGFLPMERDYEKADQLLQKYHSLGTSKVLGASDGNLTTTSSSEAEPNANSNAQTCQLPRIDADESHQGPQQCASIISNQNTSTKPLDSTIMEDLYQLLQESARIFDTSRVLQALPQNSSIASIVMRQGGTSYQHYNESIRSLEWLKEHGQCMDNIEIRNSAIPNAGRGAFARRHIPKGGLVAPAPLIHLPDRNVLTMYDYYLQNGKYLRNNTKPVHQQLLLNYCFGHEQSTLLLCPYGLYTAAINHDGKKANAKIVWSQSMRHEVWKERPISEWGHVHHSGLSFDFVALRDIAQDEEVLIDYGDAWEAAWQEHVAKFQPRTNYTPAFELNKHMDSIVLPTTYEPMYEHVTLHCFESVLSEAGYDGDDEAVEYYGGEDYVHACQIVQRFENDTYRVQILENEDDETAEEGYREVYRIFPTILNRTAFVFRDEPYQRDHALPTAFRHEMMIPDELFPAIWKNKIE